MLAVTPARTWKLAFCGLACLLTGSLIAQDDADIAASTEPQSEAPFTEFLAEQGLANSSSDDSPALDAFEAEGSQFWLTNYQAGSSGSSGQPGSNRSAPSSSTRQSRFGSSGNTYAQTSFTRPTYMIGDNSGGGCGGLFIRGQLVASLMHPTFACSRLNIAENNSPIISDRAYFSYRHFDNASGVVVFPGTPAGGQATQNIDRFTLGLEKTVHGLMSFEFRVPFNSELTSNLFFAQFANERSVLPLRDLDNELGNMSLIAKVPLWKTDDLYISGGVGLNFPTAPDVRINGRVDDPNFTIRDAAGNPRIRFDVDLNLTGVVRNQTVNISPFFTYYSKPTRRIFTQGFAQVDVAANESQASLDLDFQVAFRGNTFVAPPFSESDPIAQQTLLRLNWGVGYWIIDEPDAPYLNQLGAMFEIHYTNTLNDAKTLGPVEVIPSITVPGTNFQTDAVNLTVGNLANRVDTVNLVAGVPVRIGLTTITNGFIVPLGTGDNRGFDFEYNLLLNRAF